MFQKLRPHLLLALVFLCLTLCQQYLFYWIKGYPIVFFTFGKYLGLYFTFFIFTFIRGQKARIAALSFFMFLCPWQLGHLSYFGTQVLPSGIYHMVSEAGEVQGALKEELHHFFIPVAFLIVFMGLGIFAARKIETHFKIRFIGILFAIYLIYNPIRTYVTGNTWGRQPSTRELAGMNIYLSLSYLFGKVLPHKLSQGESLSDKNNSQNLVLTKSREPEWDNIVVVLGESLTPHHMALFGYERATTPFLTSLKNDPNFFSTIALSSGVSTDISVAFFLNLTYGSAGVLKAQKGEHCLFKLAKDQGYSTHFLSIQSEEQLRYIAPFLCSAYMEDSRSLEQLAPEVKDHQAAADIKLLPHLKPIFEKAGKHFVMLHQRGSHAPWNLRFSEQSKKFGNDRVGDYDNSVLEFDSFIKELHGILFSAKGKTLFFYLSDHGESLGEDGKWGHGQLIPRAFEIPLMIQSFHASLPADAKTLPKFLTQYNASLYLVNQLGFESNQSSHALPKDFEIFGNDIDGFAGKIQISYPAPNEYKAKLIP